MLDWTERATLVVALVFGVTLAGTIYVDTAVAWLCWGVAMVVLAGGVLIWTNRSQPPPE
ncbi:hypothetical protein [Salinadaptatus halalkaliphilus]|uniref:hypothetical protein n=1 Tax=Salinadaptatus halalkaliphilus TaxID=2419781 RepID=UPI00157FDF3B|nr:hypothetical protein [Salinadaptatus halalkaliphilus]